MGESGWVVEKNGRAHQEVRGLSKKEERKEGYIV